MAEFRKHIAICPHCRKIVKALSLSHTQWEIAKGLIDGRATAEIARDLFVSHKTVESHRAKIFIVLDISNVAQLIRWAHDQGLLHLMGWKTAEGA